LAKAGLAPFLTYKPTLPATLPYIFCEHLQFQTIAVFFLPPPPHPKTAISGKERQETAILYRSKWAWSKDYTPNPCFVCNGVPKNDSNSIRRLADQTVSKSFPR
jgi:hypothetical protein